MAEGDEEGSGAGRAWARRGLAVAAIAVTALALASLDLRTLVGSARLATVSLAESTVPGCRDTSGTVTLDRAAPAGGTTVALATTNPSARVPARVSVPEGESSAAFAVATTTVTDPQAGEVSATLGDTTTAAPLGVRPAGVAALRLVAPTVHEGEQALATVALECPAAPGDVLVSLASAEPRVAAPAQASVTVPAGEDSATVAFTAGNVDAAAAARLTATAAGIGQAARLRVLPVDYGVPERTGMFDASAIAEASGLAASRRNPGWLYLVDDEHPREVWAMRPDGSDRTRIAVSGFAGRDTESLAVGPCGPTDPGSCLYIGDTGDNLGTHPDVAILRVAEPDLARRGEVVQVSADTIRVRYPDGAHDAEALLVDGAGAVYLVTKDAGPDGAGAARLYGASGFRGGTLTDLGPVAVPAPALPLAQTLVGNVVTGGDFRPGRVVLRTYDHAVEYVAPGPDAPLTEFPTWPAREVPSAREPQPEAIAYATERCGYHTAGERVGDLWFVACGDE